ncbi:MAG TPA: SbcC/MukB-like Walker B domain-containing protein, partial [Acidimicrobiia bacterium]
TDKPSERQALLRALLDIGLFEKVMQLANARARTAEGRAQAMEESLAKLDVPTPEQVAEARVRLTAIVEARKELPSRVEALAKLGSALESARAAQEETSLSLAQLGSIVAPKDLATIEKDRVEAFARIEALAGSLTVLAVKRDEINLALTEKAPLTQLESWKANMERLDQLATRRTALDLDGLAAQFEEMSAARQQKQGEFEAARMGHAAHAVRQGLAVGEPCPVCEVVVAKLPPGGDGHGESIDRLSREVSDLESRLGEARDRLKGAEGEAKGVDTQLTEVGALLADAPAAEVVETSIADVRAQLEKRAMLDGEMSAAREAIAEAQARVDELAIRASGLLEALHTARDLVAAKKPPIPGDDPIQAWQIFEAWRLEAAEKAKADLAERGEMVEAAEAGVGRASEEMSSWLEGLGIETAGSPEAQLVLAEERRKSEIQELEKSTTEAAEIGHQLETEVTRARVATSLGTHLKSNNFEAWLLEEAMETLVDGANVLLHELTGGAYSLLASRSQFEVVDHRNADLRRTTRGLSGGETFLVALSLSLSMAEQLAELTGTSSRLECVLLDEGFGSLDQESIDIVATVLDELASGGRTVGIVTHVPELSERIPVRFEVTKGVETSTVERVAS